MKKRFILLQIAICLALTANAQWTADSTTAAGVNMYAASTSTSAIFSNGTEWNIFNAATGVHTSGNLTISRSLIDVVSYGDKVYFAGGKYGSFADPQYTKTVNVYNNVTDSWTTLNLSTAREIGGAGAINNKIVFAGGTGRTDIAGPVNMYKKVDIFDAITGARTSANISKARSNIAVGAAANKIVFAGGWYWNAMYNIVPSNNVDIYNTVTGTWTKTTLSKKRDNITSAVIGNKIIFAGGTSNMGDVTTVDIYDAVSNSWNVSNMPTAKSSMRSATIGMVAYFAGGTGGVTNNFYAYDAASNTWSTLSLPTAVSAFSLSVINDKLYFAGGTVTAGTYTDLVQIYDPATNTWLTENLSIPRSGVAAATIGNIGFFAGGTKVYGYPYPINTNRVDIFDAPFKLAGEQLNIELFNANLYPNPAVDNATVVLQGALLPAIASIYDIGGKVVAQFSLTANTQTIDINYLVKGNYILYIVDAQRATHAIKFIKQ